MFASRTGWKLTPNALTALKDKLGASGVPVLDLTESNPTRCEFSYLHGTLLRAFADPRNFIYQPMPAGLPEARQAIAAYYADKGITVKPEQIFLTASTSEAYTLLFRLLLNPNERILYPRPSYPLFDFLAGINDVHLDPYPVTFEGSWTIDIRKLQITCRPDTRAVLFVHPNNPTGSFVKQHELKALISLAEKNSLAFISDEVFSNYSFTEPRDQMKSFADVRDVLTFTLEGISKTLGLPQMKLAWIVVSGPKPLVEEASKRLEMLLDTSLSVSTPVQHALPLWLAERNDIHREISERLNSNLSRLEQSVSQFPMVNLMKPEGGWYAVLRIPKTQTEEAWCLEFLKQDHVFVHPGYFFDFEDEAYLVLSLLPSPSIFQEGMKRVFDRIKQSA